MNNSKSLWAVVVYVLFYINYASCIQDVVLRMPEVAYVGDTVTLHVDYKLNNKEHVYTLKYFKDDSEFFRHNPHIPPYDQSFPLRGIMVDTTHSSNTTVVLQNVTPPTSGTYRIEVSADSPTFDTASISMRLQVLPKAKGLNSTSNVTSGNGQRYLQKMEGILGPREIWPKFIKDLIFGRPKDGYELIQMAAFGYLNNIAPHILEQVLRETEASKGFLDSTAAVFALYQNWNYSKDIRRMTTSYNIERRGYFTLDLEPSSNPADKAKASTPCDCKCERPILSPTKAIV